MSVEEPAGSEGVPGPGGRCAFCGAPVEISARYCSACGRSLATAPRDVHIRGWLKAGWMLFATNPVAGVSIPLVATVPLLALGSASNLLSSAFGKAWWVALPLWAQIAYSVLVMPAVAAGVARCFLDGIRTGDIRVGHLGAGFRNWWPCTWIALLPTAALNLGGLIVGPPLFVLALAFVWLGEFRVVDQRCSGVEALRFAWEAIRNRVWKMVLFTLVTCAVAGAGLFLDLVLSLVPAYSGAGGSVERVTSRPITYVAALVTLPVAFGALAAGYEALRKRVGEAG
jgi:hypothetical protein